MKTNTILQGDALEVLKTLPEKSINMLITSPPYWSLRDYSSKTEIIWDGKDCEHDFEIVERQLHSGTIDLDKTVHSALKRGGLKTDWKTQDGFCNKCGAWKGQLGLEPTFNLYIKHLCDIFDEVKRVLRDDGTIWVNLGDTYNAGGNYRGKELGDGSKEVYRRKDFEGCKNNPEEQGISVKSLCMIPFRFAIEMVNRGWILRNTIIWYKPGCMPSSVKDRFTVDFEYLFFFSKKKKYYFEQQTEPSIDPESIKGRKKRNPDKYVKIGQGAMQNWDREGVKYPNRNKRCVWTITTQPFGEGICMNCGHFAKPKSKQEKEGYFGGEDKSKRVCEGCRQELITSHFAIYPEELCETPIKAGCPENGIVLDPFFGAGTTGLVALKQNKKFIGIELNKEYIEIAKKRLNPFLEQTKL